jgi:hypothetical protein
MVTVEKLVALIGTLNKQFNGKGYVWMAFSGLEPVDSEIRYDSTPKNTKTFAHTGGDGVHFGIMNIIREGENIQPVVMTVPMEPDVTNFILAESIEEFLSLGYYNGWFFLDKVAYKLEEAVLYYSKEDPELNTRTKEFIKIIKDEFKLQPIALSTTRLEELKKKYFGLLQIEK